ncbi:hypothetical protein PAERUG_P52_1_London_26_VIM_2_02_13_00728 [Pseudomonas aeruginosa]|nr:hypothetical protein PAERUG_P52_1_London_26_VIM_2_02_13_00728 [Pseudomonas aeruginosa]
MGPDEPHMRVIAQGLLDFRQVQRVAFALGSDVGVQQHRQVEFGGQAIDPRQRLVVGPRHVAVGQRGEVVVTGKDLADALPESRVQLQHATDVRVGVLVGRVETGQERMHAPPLLGWQGFHRRRHDHVGGAVPIGSGIVTSVVARPLRLVLVPFLGDRDAAEHHMVDPAFVHRLQQPRHAFAFLEKIHIVHVSVAVAIIPGMGQGCHQGQGEQCRKQGTRTGASHGIPPDRPE